MTPEEKDLLLQDICARLPYGVILNCCNLVGEKLYTIDSNGLVNNDYDLEEVKPYLFPLSSMTEEQKKEYDKIIYRSIELHHREYSDIVEIDLFDNLQEFYHKNQFDYRGLIDKSLALDATGLNIY